MQADAATSELRLALLALFAIADTVPRTVCSAALDQATRAAYAAPARLVIEAGGLDVAGARLGAARVLNSLCAACRACERGRGVEAGEVMTSAPRG